MTIAEHLLDGRVTLRVGDCLDVLRSLPDACIDAVVTDPPYHLTSIVSRYGAAGAAPAKSKQTGAFARASKGFMGKTWDGGDIAFRVTLWKQVLRVLKPGGHVAAFSATRTYHRMACAIEDAGFEIRDQAAWTYGSGFPKSHDVAKAIDKLDAASVRRERQLRFTAWIRSTGLTAERINRVTGTVMGSHYTTAKTQPLVATREHFEMLRPLIRVEVPAWVEDLVEERTVESENFARREVLGHHEKPAHAAEWRSTYDGGEVAEPKAITAAFTEEAAAWEGWGTALKPAWEPICLARKPLVGTVAENVLEHGVGALNIDGCRIGTSKRVPGSLSTTPNAVYGAGLGGHRQDGSESGHNPNIGRWPANLIHDGSSEVLEAFGDLNASCDTSPARYFYTAKADADDRIGSKHPTVKPVALMQWLVRLIAPADAVVLDLFAGTGTTGEAAWREGRRAVLIEREEEYAADIRRRMEMAPLGTRERARRLAALKPASDAGELFAGLL